MQVQLNLVSTYASNLEIKQKLSKSVLLHDNIFKINFFTKIKIYKFYNNNNIRHTSIIIKLDNILRQKIILIYNIFYCII